MARFQAAPSSSLLFGGLAMLLVAACGGTAFKNHDDGDGGTGGTGTAGTDGVSGKPGGGTSAGGTSAGGAVSGGTASGGGTFGGNANGGAGGNWPTECTLPVQSGACNAYFERWYHDPSTGICRPFAYGGCGGNANNFETLAACQRACAGGYDVCQVASDCSVGSLGCCGTCDGPEVTAHSLIAFNEQYREAIYSTCNGVACGPCPEPDPTMRQLKYFIPDCVQGQCVVHDIRTSDITACEKVEDCRLRFGTGCCEGCDVGEAVSIANDSKLETLVCGERPTPCPAVDCAPQPYYPASVCEAGHCGVVYSVALPLD